MISRSVLIVDDERDIRELVGLSLERMGLRVDAAANLAEAHAHLARSDFDFCLTDMRLPDGNGTTLVEHITAHHANTPVAMMTAYGNVEAAVAALKAGAFDFVTKPVDLKVLRQLVTHALNLGVQRRAVVAPVPRLVGNSNAMQSLRDTAGKVARSQAPVLICGERGVGKALVARMVHGLSPRKDGPFVAANCAAMPPERIDAELFGQRVGSGAGATTPGLFQAAQGGSLFLEDVADLPLHLQVKLLRVLQEKSVRPVGALADEPIDVRLLSATHHPLQQRVSEGRFNHELYYRINVVTLEVPPLRQRPEDIAPLARALLSRLSLEQNRPLALADDALAALTAYPFPGNVREMESVLERACALADAELLHAADFALPDASAAQAPEAYAEADADAETPLAATAEALARARAAGALPQALEQIEREAIVAALDAHRWNRTRTAAALGITFRALRYKLKKLGIE